MQSTFTAMPAHGAERMFKACSRKIPEFEEYLAQEPSGKQRSPAPIGQGGERNVDVSNNDYVRKRGRGIISAMPENGLKVINYDEGGEDAHAVIIVKNQYLPRDWGFFDANGVGEFKDNILVFRDDKLKDVTNAFLTATPSGSFNVQVGFLPDADETNKQTKRYKLPEDYNPGFCGIFGIIFMVFYRANMNDPNWVKNWQKICKCFLTIRHPSPDDPYKYKFSLVVAREALAIVNQPISLSDKETSILQLIIDRCANKSGGGRRVARRRRKVSRGRSSKGVRKRTSKTKSKRRSSRRNRRQKQ